MKAEEILESIGRLALIVIRLIAFGFLLVLCWRWFVSAKFHLPELSFPEALGLRLLIHTITNDHEFKEVAQESPKTAVAMVVAYLYLLLVAWLIHIWIIKTI